MYTDILAFPIKVQLTVLIERSISIIQFGILLMKTIFDIFLYWGIFSLYLALEIILITLIFSCRQIMAIFGVFMGKADISKATVHFELQFSGT